MAPLRQFVKLNSEFLMPTIGFGTFLLKDEPLQKALDYALFLGYRHIDTALSYGNESVIGQVMSDRINSGTLKRKDLFVTTKVPPIYLGKNKVPRSLEISLERLKLSYVDMFLIHKPFGKRFQGDDILYPINEKGAPDHHHYDINETWEAMEETVKDKKCKSIGLSNFSPSQIDRILSKAKTPISNLQLECHIYLQQKILRDFCRQKNIVVSGYSPLGAPGHPDKINSPGSEFCLKDPVVLKIAKKHQKPPAQILLRYLLELGVVPLPKSGTTERIKENFESGSFSLDEADMVNMIQCDRNEKYFKFERDRSHPEYPKTEPF